MCMKSVAYVLHNEYVSYALKTCHNENLINENVSQVLKLYPTYEIHVMCIERVSYVLDLCCTNQTKKIQANA